MTDSRNLIRALVLAAGVLGGTLDAQAQPAFELLKGSAGLPESPAPPIGPVETVASSRLRPYVRFLQTSGRDPLEYLVDLFDRHDIVVFCERAHPETTQYEFLSKVIRHPKFAKLVGGVFTEIGSISQQPAMDRFLGSRDMDDKLLVKINQENTFHPQGWSNANIIYFWRTLWEVDSRLGEGEKIWAYPSDIPWSWETIRSTADYHSATEKAKDRDRVMADGIIDRIESLARQGARKNKFLVVMNTRHAMGPTQRTSDGSFDSNVGAILKLRWPHRVLNVLANQPRAWTPEGGEHGRFLIQEGLWDAAFLANDNKAMGFSLKGSPFGKDRFDFHSGYGADDYESVFDGLVFITPLGRFKAQAYPGFYDDPAFVAETERRCRATGRQCIDIEQLREMSRAGKHPHYGSDSLRSHKAQISRWFLPDPELAP